MRRRTFLGRAAAASIVTAAGSGVATAGGLKDGNDQLSAPADYPGITTRDHFDVTWYGSVELDAGASEYDTRGDWAAYDDGDELLLYVHGWRSEEDEHDVDGAYTAEQALAEQGYDETVAVYTWDADKGGGIDDGWYEAKEIAERNGPKLANFVTDWNANDGRPIRMVAHSLGAQVVCSAMVVLHGWGVANAVEDLVLLGGAVDDGACAVGGEYGAGLEYVGKHVLNCYKTDDGVLDWAYELGEFDEAVGEDGVDGTPPSNLTQVDVTDVVPDHYSYPELKADGGCMDVVVQHW